jgi:hypothetical protein
MKGKLSCPVLKTSGASDSLAEFNWDAGCTLDMVLGQAKFRILH